MPSAVAEPATITETHLWHTLAATDICERLHTTDFGLTANEAARRLEQHGPNELIAATHTSPWALLWAQFQNVLIVILLIAALLSAFLGHAVEAAAIAVIVLFAVFLGFVQEFRAERAIEALRQMAAPTAAVLRAGQEIELPARELVPGDVILIRAGDKIPADARLLHSMNLQIEEAALTGESVPVDKFTDSLDEPDLALGDRRNMAYAGTAASYGRGRGVVVATGLQTEFGKIAQMLHSVEASKTPLQENLDKLGRTLARAALAIVAVIVILGLIRGQPFFDLLVFAIALAVAVVPEALPAVVTISLAIGVQRMVKRHALMRRLPAVETLGSTTVICSDKTGTLTKDEMTARKIFTAERMFDVSGTGYEPRGEFTQDGKPAELPEAATRLLQAAVLSSDAVIVRDETSGRWNVKGDPTEGAFVVAAAKAGLLKLNLDEQFPRIDEIPFSSETKRMTTLHRGPDGVVAHSKGAPEVLLDACSRQLVEQGEVALDAARRTAILETAKQLASEGLRVLAVASKSPAVRENAESEMTFLGLVGMIDPARPEAKAAIRTCELAGIKPVMITGDHPLTAQAIARELGLLKTGRIVTGAELEAMSDEDLKPIIEDIEVYARVSPAHKLRVVTTLQERGHVVAMTGDGVNDAPALKKADIGIAMGITGTDVTKEAAAMTLTDDNFASIVAAVEEGRGFYGNIKKYLMYLLSCNVGEIGLIAGTSLAGWPLPLSAVQILYVNLATDGLPALALAVDPPESDLMRRPPRERSRGIFTRPVVVLMLMGGAWSALVNLTQFGVMLQSGHSREEAMSLTFVTLVLIQFFKAYCFRSDRHSILNRPFANTWLNLAIVWELLLLVAILYVPFLQQPFGTVALSWEDWGIMIVSAFTIAPVLEFTKWCERHGWFGRLD